MKPYACMAALVAYI